MQPKKKINKESKKSEISFDVTIDLIIKILCIISMLFLFFKISIKSKKKIILKRNNNNFLKRNNKLKKENFFACFVGMGKNENKYIREYIEYYSKLGVEKFIIGDNNDNNTEKISDVIQDYINDNIIDIINLTDLNFGQSELYNLTYKKYNCNWFLYFDFDEYLEIHFEKNKSLVLKEFLSNNIFNKCEAIEFNWVMYTDNNLIYYDKRPLNERFTEPYFNFSDNVHVKSIVRGNLNKTIFEEKKSNHVPDKNLTICDSKGRRIYNYNQYILRPPVFDYGYLKHFNQKTAEEYVNKMWRGRPRKIVYKIDERIGMFFKLNKFSYEKLKFFEKKFNRTFNVNIIFQTPGFRGNKSVI